MEGETAIRRYLAAMSELNGEALAETLTEDATICVPFAPAGMARDYTGRPTILQMIAGFGTMIGTLNLTVTDVEQLSRTGDYLAYYQSDTVIKATGLPYANSYIGRFTLRAGKVLSHTEYFDQGIFVTAFGGTVSMPARA